MEETDLLLEATLILESTMFSLGRVKKFMVHHVMALYDVEMNESALQVMTFKLCLMKRMIHLDIFGWIFKRLQKKMHRH